MMDAKDQRMTEALLAELRSADATTRAAAALSLGVAGDLAAVPALIDALSDDDPDVAFEVADALGRLRDPRAVRPLLGPLAQAEAQSGEFAYLGVLSAIPGALVVLLGAHPACLTELLHDADAAVRVQAVRLASENDFRFVGEGRPLDVFRALVSPLALPSPSLLTGFGRRT
jgi:hypothetical protein